VTRACGARSRSKRRPARASVWCNQRSVLLGRLPPPCVSCIAANAAVFARGRAPAESAEAGAGAGAGAEADADAEAGVSSKAGEAAGKELVSAAAGGGAAAAPDAASAEERQATANAAQRELLKTALAKLTVRGAAWLGRWCMGAPSRRTTSASCAWSCISVAPPSCLSRGLPWTAAARARTRFNRCVSAWRQHQSSQCTLLLLPPQPAWGS